MSKKWLTLTLFGGLALGMLFWFLPSPQLIGAWEEDALTSVTRIQGVTSRVKDEANIEATDFADSKISTADLIRHVSVLLENPQANKVLEKEINTAAKTLTFLNFEQLGKQAIDLTQDRQVRQAALYILSEAGPAAAPVLAALVESGLPEYSNLANPHSRDSAERSFELSLRMSALEALDKAASQNPEIRTLLEKIVGKQKEPTLRYLAQVSLRGVETGRPGQLQKVMEQVVGKTID